MSIENLLTEITERGWYVYSMYNHPFDRPGPYQWETTIRHEAGQNSLAANGQGATMFDALSQAIGNIDRASPHKMPTFVTIEEPAFADVIAKLIPPAPTFKRRI